MGATNQSPSSQERGRIDALYQIAFLRQYARQIAAINATETPHIEIITPAARAVATGPLLLLPGSYNPPTTAHLALAESSLRAIPGSSLYLALGTMIINKEDTERATLLDRLALLDLIARRSERLGVALTNRGLYVEQARAARIAFPKASKLLFVIGFDKIEQIFDTRYYQHREAALKELFALASFLVAPRASHAAADVAAILSQPGNQRFQSFVHVLPFPADYREIASSQVRAVLQTDSFDLTSSPLAQLLPPEALFFCIETGCYSPPQPLPDGELIDRYGIRTALIARMLDLPNDEQSAIDLQRLFLLGVSATSQGRTLRRWLTQPEGPSAQIDLRAL